MAVIVNSGVNVPLNITSSPKQLADANVQSTIINPAVDAAGNPAKLSFFGVAPVTQPIPVGNTNTPAAGSGTQVFTNTTFDGGIGTSAYTIGDIVAALKELNLAQISPGGFVAPLALSAGTLAFDVANGWVTGQNPPALAVGLPNDGSIQVGDWYRIEYAANSGFTSSTFAPWHQISSTDVLTDTGIVYDWGATRLPNGATWFRQYFGRGASSGSITLQSAASNVITDTLANTAITNTVGTGAAGSGTFKSKYVNATSYQTVINSAIGSAMMDRSISSQNNVGWYAEATINGFGTGGLPLFGVDDGSIDLNNAGAGYYTGNTEVPGQTYPGLLVYCSSGGTSVSFITNGSTATLTLPSSQTVAIGDTIGIYYNSSTKVATVYYYKNGFGDLGQIGTSTLTSQIPATVYLVQGGFSGNGTTATSDALTTNYGNTSFVRTPPVGSNTFE